MGENINKELVSSFMNAPEVRRCFPPDWEMEKSKSCQCFPKINTQSALQPFADRVVLVGDCATTRLFKDGIGAAFFTAKAAASTAVLEGVSAEDFKQFYWPACKRISRDNALGKMIFAVTGLIKKIPIAKRALTRLVAEEQHKPGDKRYMSGILWDTFTGSSPYQDIFVRMLNPLLPLQMIRHMFPTRKSLKRETQTEEETMEKKSLGNTYEDGEFITREGESSHCMYVLQSGKVEVLKNKNGKEVRLGILEDGDFFGEMALFENEMHSVNIRAIGKVRLLTIDKKTLLRSMKVDPTMAYHLIEKMSRRLRKVNGQLSRIKSCDRRDWDTRPETAPEAAGSKSS